MKRNAIEITTWFLGWILAGSLSCSIASASQLEGLSWSKTRDGRDALLVETDRLPGYLLSSHYEDTIIELVLEQTSLPDSVGNPVAAGIVSRSVVLPDGEDVKIQFILSQAGRANIVVVEQGLQVVFSRLEEASEPAGASASTVSDSQGQIPGDSVSEFTDLRFSRIGNDQVQIDLTMAGAPVGDPVIFRTASPPRIALDFHGVANRSGKSAFRIGIAGLDRVLVVEDKTRMRMVMSLSSPADYDLARIKEGFVLTLGPSTRLAQAPTSNVQTEVMKKDASRSDSIGQHVIHKVDFRRTPDGGGRVMLELSDNEIAVDLQERGSEVVALFSDTTVPVEIEQRLDVTDFATPVSFIDTYSDGPNARLVVTLSERFKQSSVQSGSTLVIDISPLTEEQLEVEVEDEFGYKGAKLSLNFHSISVRAALQVIADFTGFNFVTSDAIGGDLTLRLEDVPWDQALDVILQTKGLAMRKKGNVIWVAPAAEIAAKEEQALTAQQVKVELEPLVSELIRVSYAKVEDVAKMLKSVKAVDTGISQSGFGSVSLDEIATEENSLLSSRGSVTVDVRTNSILIQDTATKLKEIKALIAKLDIPVRQVQIETRIVQASDDFSKNIGARLGYNRVSQQTGQGDVFSGGSVDQTNTVRTEGTTDFGDDALSINLPAGAIGDDLPGSYAFTIAKLGSGYLSLLDLELSALEAEGRGKILANPKILTTDKRSASIEQGQERLTTFGSAFGTAETRGQRAVLSLTVLPQITPDDRVILDVDITNDSFVAANTDTVNTKRINTQALLENGETVVIGGIYSQNESFSVTKVPVLGDLPFLGAFFRKKSSRNDRSELLVFLTPRIIDPALSVQ